MSQEPQTKKNISSDTLNGEKLEFVPMSPEEKAARNKRNITIAWSLVGFMVLIFAVTVIRLTGNVAANGGAG